MSVHRPKKTPSKLKRGVFTVVIQENYLYYC
jgi:hypothetical protein